MLIFLFKFLNPTTARRPRFISGGHLANVPQKKVRHTCDNHRNGRPGQCAHAHEEAAHQDDRRDHLQNHKVGHQADVVLGDAVEEGDNDQAVDDGTDARPGGQRLLGRTKLTFVSIYILYKKLQQQPQ